MIRDDYVREGFTCRNGNNARKMSITRFQKIYVQYRNHIKVIVKMKHSSDCTDMRKDDRLSEDE